MQPYEEIFMERADLLKYQMYAVLVRPRIQDVSIMDLATLLGWKYQAAYNVFQELLADLADMAKRPREEVRVQLLKAEELPVALASYRILLVRRNTLYQLVDYVVQQPNPTLSRFLDQAYISRSTLTRKLKALNQMLGRYQVKLKLACLTLSGNEYNIRVCLYMIYWWVYGGTLWPFTAVMQADIETQAEEVRIGTSQPLEILQQQYFLAICRLRVTRSAALAATAYLTRIEALIQAQRLRASGDKRPLIGVDAAAFNFFQLSQPQFDRRGHNPKLVAAEVMLLADPAVLIVSDRILAVLYGIGMAPLADDLYLNLLRLIAGYVLVGGKFPQNQDYIGHKYSQTDAGLVELIQKALDNLPQEKVYAGFRRDQQDLSAVVARLLLPTLPGSDGENRRLRVRLGVNPEIEGYRELAEFVNCVPWVAQVAEDESDLVIAADGSWVGEVPVFTWCPDALEFEGYRDQLIETLISARRRKSPAAS